MDIYDKKYILSFQESYEHDYNKKGSCGCGEDPRNISKRIVGKNCVGPFNALVSRISRESYLFAYDYKINYGCKFVVVGRKETAKGFLAVKDRVAFLEAHKDKSPHLNEIIQEGRKCVFVCDIDGCPIIGAEDVEYFEQTFREHFAKLWTIENIAFQFIWLSSNKEKTGSYHVLIHCTANGETYGFADLKDQKRFWKAFPRNGVFADVRSGKKMVPVIDLAIYSKNRGLRTIYSTKIGQNRPVKYWNVAERDTTKLELWQTFVLQEVTHTFDISKYAEVFGDISQDHSEIRGEKYVECGQFIANKPQILDILSKTKRNFTSRAMWIKMNCDLKYLLGDEGYDVSTEFFKSQGWDSPTQIFTNQEMFNSIPVDRETSIEQFADFCGVIIDIETKKYIPSEIIGELSAQDIQIQHWLATCCINPKKKNDKYFVRLANMLSSFLGVNFRAIAGEFFHNYINSVGVNNYIDGLYKKPCTTKYPITELAEMLEATEIVWNEVYDNNRVFDYPEQNNRHMFIRSGTGTGKTYKIFEQYGLIGKKILVVSYRRTLAQDLLSYKIDEKFKHLDWGHYREPDVMDGTRVPQILLCQLESLHKFYNVINQYDIIVFDECENLIMQLSHLKGHAQVTRTRLLFKNIMKNRPIYFISANLGIRTFNFVRRYSDREIFAIKNEFLDKAEYTVKLFIGWQEEVIRLAKAGKKLAIAINSKSGAEKLAIAMKKIYGKNKVLCMVGESDKKKDIPIEKKEEEPEPIDKNDPRYEEPEIPKKTNEEIMKDINTEWTKYNCVIYTSCIEAGVSYEIEGHFDYICASFTKQTNDWVGKYQGLFRVRHPNKKTIIMELPDDCDNDKYFPTSKTQLVRMVNFDAFMKTLSMDERIAFSSKDLHKLEVDLNDELNQQLMDNMQFQKYSDHYLKSLILNELSGAGAMILPGRENLEIKIDKNGKEKIVRKLSEEEKQEREILNEQNIGMQIDRLTYDNDPFYHRQRATLIEANVLDGTVKYICLGKDKQPIAEFNDTHCGDKVYNKLKGVRKAHAGNLNTAIRAIHNYKRVNRFHIYFDKVKHVSGMDMNWAALAKLDELTERGGHEDNSASKPIIEVHNIITALGFYSKTIYTKEELTEKLCKYLFDNNTWQLLNTVFKSGHAANKISPKVLEDKKGPFSRMKRYIDGILKSHNLKIQKNLDKTYRIKFVTAIKVETLEDFKEEFNQAINAKY